MESAHNGAPKRVTTPAGVATVGAEAQSFRSENLHTTPRNSTRQQTPSQDSRTRSGSWQSQSAANTRVSRCLLLATHVARETDHHHCHVTRRRVAVQPLLPGPPPQHPRPQAHVATLKTTARSTGQARKGDDDSIRTTVVQPTSHTLQPSTAWSRLPA